MDWPEALLVAQRYWWVVLPLLVVWGCLPRTKGTVVLRVVDGDTLVVRYEGREERVRLQGVDTPESVKPGHPVERLGKEASRYTERLVEGRKVRLEFDNGHLKRDKYGRVLAYVFRSDGLFLNLHLLEKGYARVYRKASFDRKEAFLAAEKRAREAGRGIWSTTSWWSRGFAVVLTGAVIVAGLAFVRPDLMRKVVPEPLIERFVARR